MCASSFDALLVHVIYKTPTLAQQFQKALRTNMHNVCIRQKALQVCRAFITLFFGMVGLSSHLPHTPLSFFHVHLAEQCAAMMGGHAQLRIDFCSLAAKSIAFDFWLHFP